MRRWPALTLAAALLVAAARAEDDQYLSEAIDRATNGGDPQSLTQLLHWGLQHTDLDELHAKAEGIRAQQDGAAATPGVLSASGNTGEAAQVPAGLPSPGAADQAAVARSVTPMSKDRRVELDELARIVMPDMVAEMRKALAIVEDEAAEAEARVEALEVLQEHVEDLDNARDFNTIGGFPVVLRTLAEDAEPRLQAVAAWVVGTAVQNNRELQLVLVELGALPSLLRLFGAHAAPEVRAKALFAVSGLLRACPEAQRQLGAHEGVSALLAALSDSSPKLVRKVLVLLTDLLQESRGAEEAAPPTATDEGGVPLRHAAWERDAVPAADGGVAASLRGALRNSSALCDAVVHSLRAADLDTQDKASRALEQMLDAGLAESSCAGEAMRSALRAFAAACEAAADGCGDDDVLPRVRRLLDALAPPK